ncbi:hypothetical protein [Streptomyces sp.]|uniref:hypothetical protein n=1 Tax=Streptomyces sp. TaxID=1931 RepID=UPI002F9502FF
MAILKRPVRSLSAISDEMRDAKARLQGIEKSVVEITTHLLAAIQAQDTVTEQILDLVVERRTLMSEQMGAAK